MLIWGLFTTEPISIKLYVTSGEATFALILGRMSVPFVVGKRAHWNHTSLPQAAGALQVFINRQHVIVDYESFAR